MATKKGMVRGVFRAALDESHVGTGQKSSPSQEYDHAAPIVGIRAFDHVRRRVAAIVRLDCEDTAGLDQSGEVVGIDSDGIADDAARTHAEGHAVEPELVAARTR